MSKNLLYKKLSARGFNPEHVAEVGVFHPLTSNIYPWIMQDIRCSLVEPDPKSIRQIKEHFSRQTNITLYEVALFDREGTIELVQREASTFVSELSSSPAIVNDGYIIQEQDKFTVECKTFDQIDDGTIDLLSLDMEGAEWFAIKHIASRPRVIAIETHGATYVNPYLAQIIEWMRNNNYHIWFKTGTDSVFVKEGVFDVSFGDKISLAWKNLCLFCHCLRKRAKRLFR